MTVVIIGAGISGLAIGWRVARAGRQVTILERGQAGRAASWAAAGMLAPRIEAEPGEEATLGMMLESRDRWADYARVLEAASGMDVGYRSEGTLAVALDRDDAERLQFNFRFQRRLGLSVEWLSGRQARAREAHLARGVTAAIDSPLDHQVDNRRVVEALAVAFRRDGGELIEHCAVAAVDIDGGRVRGVHLADGGVRAADQVVVAAGAWSRKLGGIPNPPPVRPVKGQMTAVQMPREAPLISRVIWGPDAYLVPRCDGRLLIGATVEEMGFDTQLTAGGLFHLLRAAWETLPGIYDLPLCETWAGLRPGSRDDAPILGPSEIDGLVMATGHHRNGILLAPLTGDAIGEYLLTGKLQDAIAPFGPERFVRGSTPIAGTVEPAPVDHVSAAAPQ